MDLGKFIVLILFTGFKFKGRTNIIKLMDPADILIKIEDRKPQPIEELFTEEELKIDDNIYIFCSMKNINTFLSKREFRKAFGLLISFLGRLNETEKQKVIRYYDVNMILLGLFDR